jgi:hypothetical protein
MTFEKWLLLQVGRDAAIVWATRTGNEPGQGFPWVEADVSIQGHPGIVIMIANGTSGGLIMTKPKFHSLELLRAGDESVEWRHLHDLPAALERARDSVRTP